MSSLAISLQLFAPGHVVANTAIERGVFGAVCDILPSLHERPDWHILPLVGERKNRNTIVLTRWSAINVRVPCADLGLCAPLLTATSVNLFGATVKAQARVYQLQPSPTLQADVVVPSRAEGETAEDADLLLRGLLKRYPKARVGLGARLQVTIVKRDEDRQEWNATGHRVRISDLSPEESIELQSLGFGKHKHFGCGTFTPWTPDDAPSK